MRILNAVYIAAVPDPGAGSIPGALTGHTNTLLQWAAGLCLAFCVGLLIYNFAKMGIAKHNNQQADVSPVLMTIVAAIGIVSAAPLINAAIG